MRPDLPAEVPGGDRGEPLVTGSNGTLMARPRGAGSPRAGAGKILPRPRRTVGGEKAGRPEPYKGGTGARAPAWTFFKCSSSWCRSSLGYEQYYRCLGRLTSSSAVPLSWVEGFGPVRCVCLVSARPAESRSQIRSQIPVADLRPCGSTADLARLVIPASTQATRLPRLGARVHPGTRGPRRRHKKVRATALTVELWAYGLDGRSSRMAA
jgi:hypothetical protein